jgi:hypothetical protein
MTKLNEKQTKVLAALKNARAEMPYKGLELVNVLRSLDKLGLAHKDARGEWWASKMLDPEPSEKAQDAPTATKAKSAILPSEKAKKTPKAAAKPSSTPSSPKGSTSHDVLVKEPPSYAPSAPDYKRLVDEKQTLVGYLYTSNDITITETARGTVIARGLSPNTALVNFNKKTGLKARCEGD